MHSIGGDDPVPIILLLVLVQKMISVQFHGIYRLYRRRLVKNYRLVVEYFLVPRLLYLFGVYRVPSSVSSNGRANLSCLPGE